MDTVTLIYALQSPERLGKHAINALRKTGNDLELSAVSLSELAIKSALGKLIFSEEMARHAIDDLRLRVLPYTVEHAFSLFRLPLRHGDPFDRQIIAQALFEKIPVITCDEKFASYDGLKAIW